MAFLYPLVPDPGNRIKNQDAADEKQRGLGHREVLIPAEEVRRGLHEKVVDDVREERGLAEDGEELLDASRLAGQEPAHDGEGERHVDRVRRPVVIGIPEALEHRQREAAEVELQGLPRSRCFRPRRR